ncbi:unnamed protein product [Pleuronectes platessa]|uniref:Uncharacterized protein n=1 Tax=Pleuronectes platessa TaxID=8262 RepID=A0A9N7UT17_PLEPL|nr:unnamed protein product [Pleuronectes platessa]
MDEGETVEDGNHADLGSQGGGWRHGSHRGRLEPVDDEMRWDPTLQKPQPDQPDELSRKGSDPKASLSHQDTGVDTVGPELGATTDPEGCFCPCMCPSACTSRVQVSAYAFVILSITQSGLRAEPTCELRVGIKALMVETPGTPAVLTKVNLTMVGPSGLTSRSLPPSILSPCDNRDIPELVPCLATGLSLNSSRASSLSDRNAAPHTEKTGSKGTTSQRCHIRCHCTKHGGLVTYSSPQWLDTSPFLSSLSPTTSSLTVMLLLLLGFLLLPVQTSLTPSVHGVTLMFGLDNHARSCTSHSC